jgi:hypothetical protein
VFEHCLSVLVKNENYPTFSVFANFLTNGVRINSTERSEFVSSKYTGHVILRESLPFKAM